jgi:hypothetical protein
MLEFILDALHDLLQGCAEHLSDLDGLHASGLHAIPDDLHEAVTPGDPWLHGPSLAFTGFQHVAPIADLQIGPTCGFEAVENLLQLSHPGLGNHLSDCLQQAEALDGGSHVAPGGYALHPAHYQHILESFGVDSEWLPFSHDALSRLLDANHGVLAVGDAHDLDGSSYPSPGSYHAFVVTDVIRDPIGRILGYRGLDSNFAGQEVTWSAQQIEQAIRHAPLDKGLLATIGELAWPDKTT